MNTINLKTDISTIHLIIISVLAIAIASLIAGVALALAGYREGAITLIAVPSAALTGLIGLLARTGTQPPATDPAAPPTPVQITNTPSNPVPVEPAQDATQSPAASDAPADSPSTPVVSSPSSAPVSDSSLPPVP